MADPHGTRAAWLDGVGLVYPLIVAGLVALLLAAVGGLASMGRHRPSRARAVLGRLALASFAGLLALLAAEAVVGVYLARAHSLPRLAMAADLGLAVTDRSAEGGDVTLVVVGESSAEGVPYRDWVSVGKVVGWQLRWLFPRRTFHVEVQARAGWTLEQMHHKLAESRRRPDVVLIYAGHNEFASRYGWQSSVPYYDDEPGAPVLARVSRLLGAWSPVCRWVGEVRDRELVASHPPGGRRPLVDVPSCTPAQARERLADFERRLERILADLERAGVLIVLVVPPGNDADFDPNRSVLPPTTPRADREAFARAFLEVQAREETDPAAAVAAYRALEARQPGFARTHYHLARCLARMGEDEEAYREFIKARDLDAHPMRCPTSFQDVYRRLAPRHRAVLVDGQALFHARHPRGRLDDALFNDGFHPAPEGTITLAEGVLAGLKARRAFGWPTDLPVPTIDLKTCADHFDLTAAAWKAACRFASGFYRMTAPIGCDPDARLAKGRRYEAAMKRLETGDDADTLDLPGIGTRPVREAARCGTVRDVPPAMASQHPAKDDAP